MMYAMIFQTVNNIFVTSTVPVKNKCILKIVVVIVDVTLYLK